MPGQDARALRAGRPLSLTFRRLIAAIWFGSGVFILIAATAMFRIGGPETVGAVLTRWHYVAIAAPLFLVFFEWQRQRSRIVLLLFIAIIVAALESVIDVRIAAIRRNSAVSISSLSRNDPVRRRFGILHGVSTLLLILDVAAAGAVIASDREP